MSITDFRGVISTVLLAVVVNQAASAQGSWIVSSAENVRVLGSEPVATAKILEALLVARHAIREVVGIELGLPIQVIAAQGEHQLRELVPHYWQRGGTRPIAASFVGPHAGFMAVRTDTADALDLTLTHEYVHLLTAVHLPDAAGWLDEGLAGFWSTTTVRADSLVIGRAPAGHLKLLRSKEWLPVKELLAQKRGSLVQDPGRSAMFYAQSWATVHYLLLNRMDRAGKVQFTPGDPRLTADVQAAVREYVDNGDFREIVIPFRPVGTPPIKTKPTSEAESLAERAAMLVAGQTPDSALPLARRALALDSDQPLALEVLGTHALLRNEFAKARPWLVRSLAVDSHNFRAALYLSLLSPDPGEREHYLVAAIRAKPDLEVGWTRLWRLYEEDGRVAELRGVCRKTMAIAIPWFWAAAPSICAVLQ